MVSLVDRFRPLVSTSSSALFDSQKTSDRINLVIRLWDSTGKAALKDTPFTIKTTSPLKNILRIYSVRETIFPNCLGYFRFMVGTRELSGEECPGDVPISDGDCIDAIPCLDDVVGSRFVYSLTISVNTVR
jgi:hypothetical protein